MDNFNYVEDELNRISNDQIISDTNKGREFAIIKVSIISIIVNILLALFKALIGFVSNSISIVLDAINNFTDAISSIITIIGTKLAGRKATRNRPLGSGRIEYFTSMIISFIILYAGINSGIESIKKIIENDTATYNVINLIILLVAVVVKASLGLFVKSRGKKLNADALVGSGVDALNDSILSLATVVAAFLNFIFGIKLEGYLGVIISIMIIKTGIEILLKAYNDLMGERVDQEISRSIKDTVNSVNGVINCYDLIIHNYGPDKFLGSIHVELPDSMTVDEVDRLEREVTSKVYEKHNVFLSGISVYSSNTSNEETKNMKMHALKIIKEYSEILQLHGFYVDENKKEIRFDIVIDFGVSAENANKIAEEIATKMEEEYKGFHTHIVIDTDISN